MRLITLNGPIGCGKSWVVKNLALRVPCVPMTFGDPLAKSTQAMLGAEWMDYDSFKKHVFFGKTGREWMIILSAECRRQDVYFYSRVLLERMRHRSTDKRTLFIADSNGFEDELDFMRVQEDIDLLACSIEPEDAPPRGQKYPDPDSRFNLAAKCTVVTKNSTLMLDALTAAINRRGWA